MAQEKGQEVRNELNRENDSLEQRQKEQKGQDIEPQAENWSAKQESGQNQDKSK